jgi:TonB-dependent receptor
MLFVNLLFGMTSTDAQRLDNIRISLDLKNISIQEALNIIEKKTNLNFIYNSEEISLDNAVSLNFEEATVEEILLKLAKDTGLSFSQLDNFIVIKKNQSIIKKKPENDVKGGIRGCVKGSDTKNALPYAIIMVVGTNNGTTTDIDGNYLLRNVDAGKQQISISYVGYITKTMDINIKSGKISDVNVVLEITSVEGNEVVVTSQRAGQQSAINEQINSNSIVSIVAPDRLQENPDANAAEAIGRLSGISLVRTGGEGSGVVIRGLDPKYSQITIDGIQVPSTNSTNRSTDISGISQYVLQGVEVFKTLTPDKDGNATAGSINLKLNEAPDGFHSSIMAQGGYNHLNDYYKNFKLQANLSNRFLDNKFGILLDVGSERVNRSDQSMTSDYGTVSAVTNGQYPQLYVNDINLNDNIRINYKTSGSLVLDYKYGSDSKVVLYNFFSHSTQDYTSASKGFDLHDQDRTVTDAFTQNTGSGNELYMSSLKGENKFNFVDISYGVAFSQTHVYTPNNRSWNFYYSGGVPSEYTTLANRSLDLGTIANEVNSNLSTTTALKNTIIGTVGVSSEDDMDRIVTPYFDAKINLKFDNNTSGYIKFGAKYKNENKTRYYANYSEWLGPANFPQFGDSVSKYISWVDVEARALTANGFQSGNIDNFLGGLYNFGWYPNFGRLNELMNWYSGFSEYYWKNPNIGTSAQMLLRPDINGRQGNNYKFKENYIGTYIMGELDLGSLITIIPGVRYEKVTDDLNGWWTLQIPYPTKTNGHAQTATHNDEYFLPDAHVILKPNDWMHIHLSYTNSLNRPDYFNLVPITYINTSTSPQTLSEGNPSLKPEHWANYDVQVAFFNNEIGYFGINGFYKIAKDVIWSPVYVRMPGTPLPEGYENIFTSDALINIKQPVNMSNPVYVKGIELEWQTSFWYLPKPFSYFSLYANYTLMSSSTKYPRFTTLSEQTGTDSRGRPVYQLVTNYYIDNGSMVNQPNSIANFSLGYNYEGLNVWLSYQFSGEKLSEFNPQPEFNVTSLSFQRWDLQVTQKLPIEHLAALLNLANINNATETKKLSGDSRPTSQENYGWTVDLGLKYDF